MFLKYVCVLELQCNLLFVVCFIVGLYKNNFENDYTSQLLFYFRDYSKLSFFPQVPDLSTSDLCLLGFASLPPSILPFSPSAPFLFLFLILLIHLKINFFVVDST